MERAIDIAYRESLGTDGTREEEEEEEEIENVLEEVD
jgi:hypothetical protein